MQLEKLLELNASYKLKLRETAAATKRALDRVNQAFNGCTFADLEALELQLAQQAEVDEMRQAMACARGKGFVDAEAGKGKEDCPYELSNMQLFWYKGWCQAKNLMPFTEVPMQELFALDYPVREFSRNFKLAALLEALAQRAYQAEEKRRATPWSELHPYAKKHYRIAACMLLDGLIQVSEPQGALAGPDSPKPLPSNQKALTGNMG